MVDLSVHLKGVLIMTAVPFTVVCHMLAVDAKTLRQWLKRSNLSLHQSPTDARVKCLTLEQVHLLAELHGRVLPVPDPSVNASSQTSELVSQMPSASFGDLHLQEKVIQLEAQVTHMQAQIAQLALQLLQEREQRTERCLLTLEAFLTSTGEHLPQRPSQAVPEQQQVLASSLHPTEKRTPLIPLIAYSASGSYVLICPKEGELHIAPDSPEWFTWLASLSSFRFMGKLGRFSARRGYNRRPNRSWYAQRAIHQKNYSKYIGVSENITTDRLEHIAAAFQSYAT
jgi:hypothetical protein